jgi:putative tryptophan/tyrosine transport system substrate-binding protein
VKRREFITLLGGAVAWPRTARAQPPVLPLIGFLNPYPETDPDLNDLLLAFKLRLRERGWTDGQNLRIDVRFVGHDYGAAREAASELAALAPVRCFLEGVGAIRCDRQALWLQSRATKRPS